MSRKGIKVAATVSVTGNPGMKASCSELPARDSQSSELCHDGPKRYFRNELRPGGYQSMEGGAQAASEDDQKSILIGAKQDGS